MDTQIFNNFVTYMGVYECLSRGPCTPNEVAKYLTNSMTSRNAAKHSVNVNIKMYKKGVRTKSWTKIRLITGGGHAYVFLRRKA